MKKIMIILPLIFCSLSAFAGSSDKLCYQEGQNNLRRYFANSWSKEKLVSAEVAEYYVGKNLDGDIVVQYHYNAQTTNGYRYSRIVMLKNNCQMVVADAHKSKQEMEADDLEAAQGGASYE